MRTPGRQVAVEELFPELVPYRRDAVRLHPRQGAPGVRDSSVGGPLLWPAGETWPVCPEHDDVLVPVVQVFRADVPDIVAFPADRDLLQVLWCQTDDHADGWVLPRVVWRDSAAVGEVRSAPVPTAVDENLVPRPCVVHPERVMEYAGADLPVELWQALEDRFDRLEAETGWHYEADLAVAPGTKLLGYPSWSQEPDWPDCPACRTPMRHLLTVASWEGEDARAWRPDGEFAGPELSLGDLGGVYLFECVTCPGRPGAHRYDC